MKTIKIYSLHPSIKSLDECISYYKLEELQEKFNFVWSAKEPQYLFVSEHVYYYRKYMKQLKKYYESDVITIFWAGECIAPDMNIFDYAVCWDDDSHISDRIVRIPPARIKFEKFVVGNENNDISIEQAHILIKEKTKFCNFIYSNPDAHPMRDKLFYLLSKYKKVDSLGKHLNNVEVKGTGYSGHWEESTLLKEGYKFTIASENAEYRGYTSEKILTSFQAHTVPIYWGNPNVAKEYNAKAFINVHDFDSLEELVAEVKRVDNSDEIWCKMVSEPWETAEQVERHIKQMQDYTDFFVNIFNQDYCKAHRIPKGYHPQRYREWFLQLGGYRKIRMKELYKKGINFMKRMLVK